MNKNSPGANLAKHMLLVVNSRSTLSVLVVTPFRVAVCLTYRYATAVDVGFIMLFAPVVVAITVDMSCIGATAVKLAVAETLMLLLEKASLDVIVNVGITVAMLLCLEDSYF